MIKNKLSYLNTADASYTGIVHDNVLFTEKHQLLNKKTWDKFVEAFTEDSDDNDIGWRCEYWGKMMRGASLTYMYHGTDELYEVLDYAVRSLLKAQRDDGRFSTYSEEKQFNGWDLWGRKYVITGMLHFYRICKDDSLKEEIISALCRHADYIVSHIGDGEGKKSILQTSDHWLCVNSCTILEPFIDLYKLTKKQSYLDFAEYIISTGGCSGGDLINFALENKVAPFQYPVIKAYETMSFFEGLLAYYELTGNEKYLTAVTNFVEQINDTDITIIGCSGCTQEIFDNSAIMQTNHKDMEMQETCVTVTWMRLISRLLLITADVKYADRVETSAFNALYGSINTKNQDSYDIFDDIILSPLPFDSYSPLYNNKRGLATGGLKHFRTGGFYGCCACISSAGTGLLPLSAMMKSESGFVINEMLEGVIKTTTPNGKSITFNATSDYPANGKYTLAMFLDESDKFDIQIRIPGWCDEATIKIGDEIVKAYSGYFTVSKEWHDGDTLEIDLEMYVKSHTLNGKTAYTYGPLVLARDEMKDGNKVDSEFAPTEHNAYRMIPAEDGEIVRIMLECEDGELLLTDYQSCGKHWRNTNANMSAWLNAK